MKPIPAATLGLILCLVGYAWADSIDQAAAATRGVSVEVIQLEAARAKILDLQKQIESLKSQAATAKDDLSSAKADVDKERKRADANAEELAKLKAAMTPEQKVAAATREQADHADEKLAADIQAAIKKHELVVGMSIEDVDKSLSFKTQVAARTEVSASESIKIYRWVYTERYSVDGRTETSTATWTASFRNGKMISYYKGG